ncbi:MAG: ribonuclease R [Leptospiraceae bacterium]|nr:VacB/RNase II family 3'-5' exoribonuclease [Leptospiraceae bacterium]MCK6381567.1 ribonuclease R [Leptospiraceae bacterium]NUM41670.1 VacB/RNase II family 3'-5' exoribonuclease [Leptospiraceae bacterium]
MKRDRIITKIYEYLQGKSGKEVNYTELLKNFANQKVDKKGKKLFNNHNKDKSHEKESILKEFLSFLEEENLITKDKKFYKIASPFYLSGKISISKKGDGFVKMQSGSEVFIPSQFTENSIHGDIVKISPLGFGKKGKLEGSVLKILKRGRTFYRLKITSLDPKYIVGKFLDMPGEECIGIIQSKSILSENLKRISIDDILIVTLKTVSHYEENQHEAIFVRFESDTKEDKDFFRILMKYDLNLFFPETVSINFPDEVNDKTVSDWSDRVDLRELYAVTIDGETAKDFDDAVSYTETEGKIKFYVHIADVSNYVEIFSDLDKEAYNRSTSVYLANRVVPMLPPELSENLCSLVAEKNRLAFTVEMEGNWEGKIISAKFYKSIIKVDKRFTYEEAEERILNGSESDWFVKLLKFTDAMRNDRKKSGRVDLNLKENSIVMGDNNSIVAIQEKSRLKSHVLIEELMLSANIKVAEFLRKKKVPALYRIHESMDEEKLETLNLFLKLYGFQHTIKNSSYKEIENALQVVSGQACEKIFNYFLLRSFMQAYYGGDAVGHWGLGFKDYCHFTSPIRRYPDLVVHRVLHSILKSEEPPYSEEEIGIMGNQCSEKERIAADAERDIVKLKTCRYLEATGIKEFKGAITGIRPQSVFVELISPPVEGVVHIKHFTNEGELVIPNDFSFVSKKYAKQFFLGQILELNLEKIDIEEIKIYLSPIIK